MIHCGDITTLETKKYFQENFRGKIYFVEGNADITSIEQEKSIETKRTNRFQVIKRAPVPFLELIVDQIQIAVCHKKDKAIRLAKKGFYHFVFFGHTHKPWQEKIDKSFIINPGTLAGMFTPPSFATYNTTTKQLELIQVHNL